MTLSDVIVSALISASMGAISAILVTWMRQEFQSKQDTLRFAIQTALKEFEIDCQLAQHNSSNCSVAPFSVYLIYHLQLMKEDLNEIDEKKLKEISERTKKLAHSLPGAPQN